jgi:hypothetical protein
MFYRYKIILNKKTSNAVIIIKEFNIGAGLAAVLLSFFFWSVLLRPSLRLKSFFFFFFTFHTNRFSETWKKLISNT